jgi:hypothetical protein
MGYVGYEPLEASVLQGVAAIDADGRRLCLLVINLGESDALTAAIDLKGFRAAEEGAAYTLTGEHAWSNNEPEGCPQGDCVRIEEKSFPVPGSEFPYTFPPHSATALVLYGKDSGRKAVAPPRNLQGTIQGSRVRLRWEQPEGSAPGGYHLYRSRFARGPFRNRVNTLPADRREAADTLLDAGGYTYAVRSFNVLGEEGPFSNTVRVENDGRE